MKRVLKYHIDLIDGRQVVNLPAAKIVHVAAQHDRPTLWVEVDSDDSLIPRDFYILATGQELPAEQVQHLGTIHIGWTVWHVYEGVR